MAISTIAGASHLSPRFAIDREDRRMIALREIQVALVLMLSSYSGAIGEIERDRPVLVGHMDWL